jgi:hypothetical protein
MFERLNRETNLFNSEGLMRKFSIVLIAAVGALTFAARAQDTNALKTEIGLFESQTGVVIIKGFGVVGSITTGAADISVRCKESTSAATGHKDYGLAVVMAANQWQGVALADYDELDALINAMDYLGKMTYNVTSLPGFEATFSTKSGLRLIAHGDKREGGIRTFVQYNDGPRILLASDQWAQLAKLIQQAKATLNSLGAGV